MQLHNISRILSYIHPNESMLKKDGALIVEDKKKLATKGRKETVARIKSFVVIIDVRIDLHAICLY